MYFFRQNHTTSKTKYFFQTKSRKFSHKKHTSNFAKIVLVLLSPSVKTFSVSCMRHFFSSIFLSSYNFLCFNPVSFLPPPSFILLLQQRYIALLLLIWAITIACYTSLGLAKFPVPIHVSFSNITPGMLFLVSTLVCCIFSFIDMLSFSPLKYFCGTQLWYFFALLLGCNAV